jgi:hypothetical protein
MASCQTSVHKGKSVVIVDLSNSQPEEFSPVLDEAHKIIASMAPKSALILTDGTNAVYNTNSSNLMKDFSSKNTPFVKASAVVGADGMRKILVTAVAALTKREIRTFDKREEALDWLVNHP